VTDARRERQHLRAAWPDEFRDGVTCALTGHFSGGRERGGYPLGFHTWPLERRNAWYAGYNYGRVKRPKGAR
jgi:hypothetical protein